MSNFPAPRRVPLRTVFPAVQGTVLVFYADLLYQKFDSIFTADLINLPDGCYIWAPLSRRWLRKDLTPILDEDVPAVLKMHLLLIT